MVTAKARLKIKQGRKWTYQDIEIPIDEQIIELANRLHSARQPYKEMIGEWTVIYKPSRPSSYKVQSYELFSNDAPTDRQDVNSPIPAMFEIRLGPYLKHAWRTWITWLDGDDKAPIMGHDDKKLETPRTVKESIPAPKQPAPERSFFEGREYQIEATEYERNPEARALCISHHGSSCLACGFDFGKVYGQVADGYIHVHHLTPISDRGGEYQVDPVADLIPLCPNRHAVAHLRTPPYDLAGIKSLRNGTET